MSWTEDAAFKRPQAKAEQEEKLMESQRKPTSRAVASRFLHSTPSSGSSTPAATVAASRRPQVSTTKATPFSVQSGTRRMSMAPDTVAFGSSSSKGSRSGLAARSLRWNNGIQGRTLSRLRDQDEATGKDGADGYVSESSTSGGKTLSTRKAPGANMTTASGIKGQGKNRSPTNAPLLESSAASRPDLIDGLRDAASAPSCGTLSGERPAASGGRPTLEAKGDQRSSLTRRHDTTMQPAKDKVVAKSRGAMSGAQSANSFLLHGAAAEVSKDARGLMSETHGQVPSDLNSNIGGVGESLKPSSRALHSSSSVACGGTRAELKDTGSLGKKLTGAGARTADVTKRTPESSKKSQPQHASFQQCRQQRCQHPHQLPRQQPHQQQARGAMLSSSEGSSEAAACASVTETEDIDWCQKFEERSAEPPLRDEDLECSALSSRDMALLEKACSGQRMRQQLELEELRQKSRRQMEATKAADYREHVTSLQELRRSQVEQRNLEHEMQIKRLQDKIHEVQVWNEPCSAASIKYRLDLVVKSALSVQMRRDAWRSKLHAAT